jgi:hypothetical protein
MKNLIPYSPTWSSSLSKARSKYLKNGRIVQTIILGAIVTTFLKEFGTVGGTRIGFHSQWNPMVLANA